MANSQSKTLAADADCPRKLRIAELLWALGLALVPLIIAPQVVLEYETTPRLVFLLWVTAALLLCWRRWWPGVVRLAGHPQGKLFMAVLGAQFASVLLSTLFSQHPGLSLAGSEWRRYGCLTQVAVLVFSLIGAALAASRPRVLRISLPVLCCCAATVSLYAVGQHMGVDWFLLPALYSSAGVVRAPGTFGHAVYLGGFLAAVVPISIRLALDAGPLRRRLFWLGITVAAIVATVLSGSRSALLGLAAGVVVSCYAPRSPHLPRLLRTVAICGGIAALLLAPVALTPHSSLGRRIQQWREDFYGGPRLLVWRESASLIATKPLLGIGPEMFSERFRERQSGALSVLYPDFVQESPHNLVLDGVLSQGIPYLLVLGGMVYLVLHATGQAAPQTACLRASLIAGLISLQFVTLTITGAVMLYGVLGLYVGSTLSTAGGTDSRAPGGFGAVCWSLALLLAAAGVGYLWKDMAYADFARAARSGDRRQMADAYRRASDGGFPSTGDDLFCSRQFAAIARAGAQRSGAESWELAEEAAARAERAGSSPADAAYQLALLAIARNDPRDAESRVRRAVTYAPNWYKPHLLLAQLLYYSNRIAESHAAARRALNLAGRRQPEVAEALRQFGMP